MKQDYKQTNNYKTSIFEAIVLFSRNKLFYTKFNLIDTFQNRIHLIFIHISFIFIKIKQKEENKTYKKFYQELFDLAFSKIELNMREIGYGDTVIYKNMRQLVKNFYNILLVCEKYKHMNNEQKTNFFDKYIELESNKNTLNVGLIDYFNKYEAFCFALSSDSVLKGEIKFNYK